MNFAESKNSPFREYSGDSTSCISTFVIKIYNLLNVLLYMTSVAVKRIGYLLAPRRHQLSDKGHSYADNPSATSLLQAQ